MNTLLQKQASSQLGLSLVELLIAMALSLILMTGVISIFISAKQGYSNQDATAQVQENARFALDIMTREIRMAGYGGCSDAISVANTLEGYTGVATNFSFGVEGYEGDDDNDTFPDDFRDDSEPNTDAIVIHTVDSSDEATVESHNPSAATIHFAEDHSMQKGDVLIVVDSNCSNMGIFINSNPPNEDNDHDHLVHNIGGSAPKNCTKSLKGNFDCADDSTALAVAYSEGSSVLKVDSFAFFLGPSALDASVTSLYRNDIDGESEELVEGVSDLEIFYGVASGANIQYEKANGVEDDEWEMVKTVRLILTTSSLTNVDGAPLSKTFTATTMLRNRGEES